MTTALPKRLIFIRHGIAEEAESFPGEDRDRPLTDKGRQKAQAAFRTLLRFFQPTFIFSSDCTRALQTAELILGCANESGLPPPQLIATSALGVNTTWSEWLTFFQSFTERLGPNDIAMIVGHEPSISTLFARHLGLRTTIGYFKKAGVGVVEPAGFESGTLVAFLPPKFLRQEV